MSTAFIAWAFCRFCPSLKRFRNVVRLVAELGSSPLVGFERHELKLPARYTRCNRYQLFVHPSLNYVFLLCTSGLQGQAVLCFSMGKQKERWRLVHTSCLLRICFHLSMHPSRPLVAIGEGSRCRIVNVETHNTLARIGLPELVPIGDSKMFATNWSSFHARLPLVAVSFGITVVGIWNTDTYALAHKIVHDSGPVSSLSFHPSKEMLVIACEFYKTITLWTPDRGSNRTIDAKAKWSIENVCCLESHLLARVNYNELVVYDLEHLRIQGTGLTALKLSNRDPRSGCVFVNTYPASPTRRGDTDSSIVWIDARTQTLQMAPVSDARTYRPDHLDSSMCLRLGCRIGVSPAGTVVVQRLRGVEYKTAQAGYLRALRGRVQPKTSGTHYLKQGTRVRKIGTHNVLA